MKLLKLLNILVLLTCLGGQCGRIGLDDRGRRHGGIDPATGLGRFDRDQIRFNYEDLSRNPYSDCRNYTQGASFSLLPPTRKIQNCLNNWIDKSLAPVCKHEEKLYALLDRYRRDRAPYYILEAIEQEIYFNEEQKYHVADSVYRIADEVDRLCRHFEEHANKDLRKKYEWLEWAKFMGGVLTQTECHSTTQTIDHKARIVCHRIDFSKIEARRR